MLQNQHGAGKASKRWDRTGLVLDDLGHNKYRIKVDGSGRVTDRNRQFLRQFTPVTQAQPGPRPDYHQPVVQPEPLDENPPEQAPSYPEPSPVVTQEQPQPVIQSEPQPVVPPIPQTPESPAFVTPPSSPVTDIPRRSTRMRRPPERLNYNKF